MEAYQLLSLDSSLREWVSGGQFVFADGYFVLADKKYVTAKEDGLHLTAKVIAVLYHVEGINQRMLTFHPKYQANFKYEEDDVYPAFRDHILTYDENEEIEPVKRLGDPTTTLCRCLWFLMQNRKWSYPETFNNRTGLHKNYHGKIKNDKSDNKLNYYQAPERVLFLLYRKFRDLGRIKRTGVNRTHVR